MMIDEETRILYTHEAIVRERLSIAHDLVAQSVSRLESLGLDELAEQAREVNEGLLDILCVVTGREDSHLP